MGYVLVHVSEWSSLNIAAKANCSRPLTTIRPCKITNFSPSRKHFGKKTSFFPEKPHRRRENADAEIRKIGDNQRGTKQNQTSIIGLQILIFDHGGLQIRLNQRFGK